MNSPSPELQASSEQSLPQRLLRLWPYYRSAKAGFIVAGLAAIVAALTEPLLPGLMKPLLDQGFKPGGFSLWLVPAALLGLFALRGVAAFAAEYALAWAGQRGTHALRTAMFEHLLRASPQALQPLSASSLANTLVYETQIGSAMLVASLNSLLRNGLIVMALAGYLMWLNWQLSLFVLLTFPPVAWVMRKLSRRLHRFATQSQAATDELAYVVEENSASAQVVRVHGAQASQTERFAKSSLVLQRLAIKATASSAAMTPITQFMVAIPLSAVIMIALWQAQSASQTVGSFTAFVTAMLMLIAPVKHLADVAGPITRGLAAVERGLGLLENLPTESGGSHRPTEVSGRIEFQNLSYAHPARADETEPHPALTQINLSIPPGQSLALVGPSGAGKTTLMNLLPRFIDAQSGTVCLDGVALKDWDLAHLRRQFALVSQHTVLFNDSIENNVALGETADGARVQEALQAANLLAWTRSLPQGTRTVIGHNALTLSGGQRQRLAIARAIYKRAKIVLLDEATAALDNESERHVQAALEALMGRCTTIVIAHRLSTIQRCDRIVAMDQGRIVESGTHAQLLAANGLYARLHSLQFADVQAGA
jgi:ATP-binding cassette, subfamily B, bacterial MsbA